jgi:DEAD/DEAH box helicase domain-containing protein
MTPQLPGSWQVAHTLDLPTRVGCTVSYDDLPLSDAARALLAATGYIGLWEHQHRAIAAALHGADVCLATPTASGKTLVFHVTAIEAIRARPDACILALYPTKALGEEQEGRWRRAMKAAGFGDRAVARIDGTISGGDRLDACKHARVIVATPDVIHAWLLPRLGQRGYEPIAGFMKRLVHLVVDEVHAYTGVFGTNSSFLFRRMEHVRAQLGGEFRIIGASATIADPTAHATTLFGRELEIIGPEHDSSPRHPVRVLFARTTGSSDLTGPLSELFLGLAEQKRRFMAFFDSRKAAEQAGSIVQRELPNPEDENAESFAHLDHGEILPYRAGYEADHRALIQQRLTAGTLAGVLCTSAMELGLDIPGLDVAVLVGVPHSGTSLHQRIGRVGRSAPGYVIVVHTGTIVDDMVFAQPDALMKRPLNESAIYLESPRVQYIHSMCLARPGGEHDQAARSAGRLGDSPVVPSRPWPDGFQSLCESERAGAVRVDLRDMRREVQDAEPAHVFPLRDVESQFNVELRIRREIRKLGSLSHAQVMREAYPGAIYYYAAKPYRVIHVNTRQRVVQVVSARRYTTRPSQFSRVTPQEQVYRADRCGELLVAEGDVKIRNAVLGYTERRGMVIEQVHYPLTNGWVLPAFVREFFTTGVVLAHPALNGDGVDPEAACAILREAFFLSVPFDRQDIDVSSDRLQRPWGGLSGGARIFVLHDQTYGSLRLSGRLMEPGLLERVLALAGEILTTRNHIAAGHEVRPIGDATRAAVRAIADAVVAGGRAPVTFDTEGTMVERPRVLLPQSRALSGTRPGWTFEVHRVFVHLSHGLSYRGAWIGPGGQRELTSVRVDEVEPGAGARWGEYDAEGDEVIAA